jgi:cytochrome P450
MTSRKGWQIMAGRGMRSATSAIREPSGCPVSTNFDPLSETFLSDPYAVLAGLPLATEPMFYAESIGYYVITRRADIEQVFRDPDTYSAAGAQHRDP